MSLDINKREILNMGTKTETDFVNELAAHISKGFEAPNAIQYLRAAMLYCYPHQLPLKYKGAPIPQWFFSEYLNFLLESPNYFKEIGEADRYFHYMEELVNYIHSRIFSNSDSKVWQEVAWFFTQKANFIPLYFTTADLRTIYKQRAEIVAFALKSRGHQLNYVFPARSPARKKIRFGVLNEHFNPQTETFVTIPAFEYLDREQFEIILYAVDLNGHRLEQYCQSRCDRLVKLPTDLTERVQTIRADDLDILLIGTNLTAVTKPTTELAVHRLARIQITSVSSCVTTGMSNIDYYISGTLTEPVENAPEHYSEKLIVLDGPAHCYSYYTLEPAPVTVKLDRKTWGVTAESVVFFSGANFYKIIPEVRETWAKIIAAVPNSVLVLYPFGPNWDRFYPAALSFVENMHAIFAKYGIDKSRLVVLNTLPTISDIKESLKLGDVYLDSYPFSGVTSLLDPLEIGLPTVVMDGNAFRSRMGSGLLRELNIPDLIADSEEAYIKLGLALGTNPELRRNYRAQIQAKMQSNPRFLDSRAYGNKIGALFQKLFQEWQNNSQASPLSSTDFGIFTPQFLNRLSGCLNLYEIDPSDRAVITELRQIRKHLADFWISLPAPQLESLYPAYVGKGYQSLLSSSFRYEPLTEIEQVFIEELSTHVSLGFNHPKAINYFMAALLYRSAYQLPLRYESEFIPAWFFPSFIVFMLDRPSFNQLGDLDSYFNHLKRFVYFIHTQIFKNQDSTFWRQVAGLFTKTYYFVSLLFTTSDLRELYTQCSEIIEFALKTQGYQIDYVFTERPQDRKKIRLGILKDHFKSHPETFFVIPAFAHLNRSDFEVIVYTQNVEDPLNIYSPGLADRLVKLPNDLASQVQVMRADDLDILLVGTILNACATNTVFLSLHRLARIQVTSLTSPATTGMRHMDYYIAGTLTAPLPTAREQYREQLLNIHGSGLCFYYDDKGLNFEGDLAPTGAPIAIDRNCLGIPERAAIFMSGASFFKITPELRETWAKIIAAVPNSVLVLYPFHPQWSSAYPELLFVNQMSAILAKYGIEPSRLRVLKPVASSEEVRARLKLADVYLDSYPYSGATSILDPLKVGLPPVVREGNILRSKQAAALLRELQMPDLIADSEDAYIQLAVTLGTTAELRQLYRDRIHQRMQKAPSFLDTHSYCNKMESLFQEIFQKWQNNSQHLALPIQHSTPNPPPTIPNGEFLNRLIGCVNLYQIDPSERSVLEELREIRRQFADFWLSFPPHELESLYLGDVGQGHQTLRDSGIQNELLTEGEQRFLDELAAQLANGLEAPKAINYLLAAMLYWGGQLAVSVDSSRIPRWLQ